MKQTRILCVAAMAVVMATVLGACGQKVDTAWAPAQSGADEEIAAIEAAPEHSPEFIDPAAVPGLSAQRFQSVDTGIGARWEYLPEGTDSAGALNDRVDELVKSAIAQQREMAGTPEYLPKAQPRGSGLGERNCVPGSTARPAAEILADPRYAPQGLDGKVTAVVCDIVVAWGPFFGESIRIVTGSGTDIDSDSTTTLVMDTATGEMVEWPAVFADDAASQVYDLVVPALRHRAGSLWEVSLTPPSPAAIEAIEAALKEAFIGADGSLHVVIPGDLDAPELASLAGAAQLAEGPPLPMRLPPSASKAILSPFAQHVYEAMGTEYTGPADVPAAFDRVSCDLVPCMAITFDDGPGDQTDRLLDILADHGVTASFFLIGRNVAGNEGLVSREVAEGHTVGTHTWSHGQLTKMPPPQAQRDVASAIDAVAAVTGTRSPWFRPPYGDVNGKVMGMLGRVGVVAVLWNIDTNDWKKPGTAALVDSVASADAGSIVLMHDIHASTVDAVPDILDALADRGLVPVSLERLYGGVPMAGTRIP